MPPISTIADELPPKPLQRMTRAVASVASRPLWVALAITALITAARLRGTVDSDVAWQLWIADRIHAGAALYRDIIETNPPLWFWMALPVDRLATLLHIRTEMVLIVGIGLLIACSLAATERLIVHIPAERRALLLGYGAVALAAMPWMHVGQREQIVLIGTIPYSALVAARRDGVPVPVLLAALIGIGAALGFALKQYFLLVPLLLELWLLAGAGRRWRPVRPETLAIVAVGVIYAVALVSFEPDYLTSIVPLIRLAYGVFGAPSLIYLFGPFAVVGLAIVSFVAFHLLRRRSRGTPFATALFVAALAFACAYFIQFKGWPYHAIPMIGCGSLALAALLAENKAPPRSIGFFAPALLLFPLVLAADEQVHASLPSPDLLNAVGGLNPGDPVGFLTTETAIPWSVTLQGGYRYASRYNGFWMMQAIVRNEDHGNRNPRLTRLGQQIVAETTADFTCTPPRRIIVWRPQPGENAIDVLPFFLRSPAFAVLLSHYKIRSRTSLETYELASPLPAPTTACRSGI